MSEYLDTPTCSLEQLRDELRSHIEWFDRAPFPPTAWYENSIRARLATVEAEIAHRSKT